MGTGFSLSQKFYWKLKMFLIKFSEKHRHLTSTVRCHYRMAMRLKSKAEILTTLTRPQRLQRP